MSDLAAPEPQSAAPGWYPQAGQQRYWDGKQWTDHWAPAVATPTYVQVIAAPRGPTNPQATASLVLGIIAVVFGWVPFIGAALTSPLWILAIVYGFLGRSKAKTLDGLGEKNANGGIVLAFIPLVITAIAWIVSAVAGGYNALG